MKKITKNLLLQLSPEQFDALRVESQKLNISMTAFIRLLLRQWYNGIIFEKDKGNNNGK